MKRLTLILLLVIYSCNFIAAQGKDWIKEHYTKKEYQIPMRDGVKLFTAVYTPKDTSKKYPILMVRTPYRAAPYGEDNYPNSLGPNEAFAKDGYIFVFQDVRGKFMSEGEFVNMRPYIPHKKSNNDVDETTDTYDTIEWLINNIKHNNGRVGIWGISYPGFYAAMSLIDSHPALKAVSPQAPIADWFIGDDMHHNGAFSLSMSFNFFKSFDQPRDSLTTEWKTIEPYDSPDMYTFFLNLGPLKNINQKYFHEALPFWNQIMEHGTYDEFWKARNNLPHFNNTKPAVLIVGGWYDSEDLYGPVNIYRSIEEKNSSNDCRLVMGPWSHGAWARSDGNSFGDFIFPDSTSKYYNDSIIFPFFNYYLKGEGKIELPEVLTYRTGSNRWIRYKEFPPKESIIGELHLGENGTLLWEKPVYSDVRYDEFISDPDNPVPYTATFYDSRRMYNRTYMSEDQRFADARPDVLSYSTAPLEEDYTISGPIDVNIYVSTSGTDADWVVKVIDVYPYNEEDMNNSEVEYGGYQRLIRYEIMRGKFRNSYEKPEPFVPNQITNIKFRLNDIDHTFLKGHRIMIQIQSSFFPFFDRNPQKFVDIYKASEEDFHKAVHRVYFNSQYPSHIKFLTNK
ncbi:CocE/NonD family hydrolase [Melioribacter sp. OK-6-Me]|uniref:CocE/NonD family hydrolase n=1 Tax=unclassified Melioribacter TaxID=2627329 RepID=UPI003EDACCD3